MKHSELLKIFVLFGSLSISNGFGPPSSPPADSTGDSGFDDHLYPCYTSINCVYRGTAEHDRIDECVVDLDTYDMQIGLNFYNKSIKAEDYDGIYDLIDHIFCQVDTKTRKEVFDKLAQGAVEIYSMGCERRYRKSACDHFSVLVDCLLTLLNDLKEEEKCDIEEFERASSSK
ncbi:hypothetical protein TNCV_950351 [Trichonephila clavipes]|nr:hypothetical protein TNCV_950351 [Trichonephila clavipes]